MKKSLFLAALTLVTGMALTGCKENNEPRLLPATGTFELFAPAENNYTYDLTESTNTLTLTTSGQPDYGVATPTSYQVQVSLDNKWEEGVKDAEGNYTKYPTYYSLPTVNTQSVINVSALELNQAITYLQGIHDEDQVDLYDSSVRPIFVRVRAYVAYTPAEQGYLDYTQVFSNVIKINKVQPSLEASLPLPAKLYIIGNYQGWNINGNDDTRVVDESEYGIGSNIYTGYLPASALNTSDGYFRFYSALGDWESNSYGHQIDDEGTAVAMKETDGNWVYNGPCVAGKGSWIIDNYPGDGWCKIIVDLNLMTVSFQYDPDYSE